MEIDRKYSTGSQATDLPYLMATAPKRMRMRFVRFKSDSDASFQSAPMLTDFMR